MSDEQREDDRILYTIRARRIVREMKDSGTFAWNEELWQQKIIEALLRYGGSDDERQARRKATASHV